MLNMSVKQTDIRYIEEIIINFITKLSDITLDPSDEEVGVFEYGTYDDVTGEYTPD